MKKENRTVAELQRAVTALQRNDLERACVHIERAHALARTNARRDRQLVEIAQCAVNADLARAAGLAAEHRCSFPEDVELLVSIVGTIC
jgi:hypothetical protein